MKETEAKSKAKNITVGFLDCLLGIAEGFVVLVDRREVYKIAYGYFERKLTIEKIGKHFDSLRRRGFIEFNDDANGNHSFRFTNKAKLALVDRIADKLSVDNRFYFVSFDIPEKMRIKRNSFRKVIKRLGFREIQKSLWVCNKNVGQYVELAAREYRIYDYIVYMATDNTNINSAIIEKMDKKLDK